MTIVWCLTQLAVMLADGGDCLADIAVLRHQPELFGRVGSDPTVWRVLDSIHSLGLREIAAARAAARARVWAAGAAPDEVVIDIDGTLLDAHSDKQDTTPTYKRGFGFYPILAYFNSGEGLAGVLRPGRAVPTTRRIISPCWTPPWPSYRSHPTTPRSWCAPTPPGRRTGSSMAVLTARCGSRLGCRSTPACGGAFMLVQEEDWTPAVEADGRRRDGAWLVELTDLHDHRWGEGVRVLARRERPHPGAQLTLFDTAEGFRHQVFITDPTDDDIAALELRHRHRAHVENRIPAAKDSGLHNVPCEDFVRNQAWPQLVLIAQDLHAWTQALCFDGDLAIAEPKKLRHRVWHAAAVVVRSGRKTIVRFQWASPRRADAWL